MIRRVRFTNFGSLASVDVRLGPLTVLIGPNGSGKTMFLRAVRALALLLRAPTRAAVGPLIDQTSLDLLVRGASTDVEVTFEAWLEDPDAVEPSYRVSLAKLDGQWVITTEHLDFRGVRFRSETQEVIAYQGDGTVKTLVAPRLPARTTTFPAMALRVRHSLAHGEVAGWPVGTAERSVAVVQSALALMQAYGRVFVFRPHPADLLKAAPPSKRGAPRQPTTTGAGFAAALQLWMQSVQGRSDFEDHVLPALRRAFPHITAVGFTTDATGERVLEFGTTHSARAVPAQLESDGVSLTLFLLATPFLFRAGFSAEEMDRDTLCLAFEEPETGTHPALQGQRLAMLRGVASGALAGRPIQVIATTHSVDLLRHIAREELPDVLRIAEMTDNGTVISQLAGGADIDRLYRLYEGDLGAAWYSGAIGGVPELPAEQPFASPDDEHRSVPR